MHNNSIIMKGNFNRFHISGNYTFNRKSDIENNSNEVIPPPAGRDNILETVIKSEKRNISSSDLSIYRTPSGKYYCRSCNLTVNSQAQFIQHTESRKHKHRVTKTQCKLK
ncbi:hypothetical protein RUM44_012150 [Polyplax serrata]|uniref:C2H2-type domain-containing protein n=1 Tax=Polyplax serrata TaxID=468196 RepID=A0ABR1BAH4_POLSC